MLNHTYTSVKNANLVDCGKKQHISSQPSPLLKDNFLGEFRTELDKKKVLSNLGIVTDLSLEWEYIKGDINRSVALMLELDSRTKYTSLIGEFKNKVISVVEGLQYLETILGEESEIEQNTRIETLENITKLLNTSLEELNKYIEETIIPNASEIENKLENITEKVNNITNLILVSNKEGNALILISEDNLQEGEVPGLYVPDLSSLLSESLEQLSELQTQIESIQNNLDDFVTKEELGGEDFNFVNLDNFDNYTNLTNEKISNIEESLKNTLKTDEDGSIDTLYVNTISNNKDNIKITNSFEIETGIPLDVRFVVKDLELLYSLKPLVCYSGMGVIVSSQASLYILREPIDGNITQEYIQNPNSWKCPEDLVIEVLTQEEYDKKESEGSINPNMFYYIHEEVIDEPVRENFNSDEEYTEALNKWLRVLQLKYMSAVWGQEIEKLVSDKASVSMILSLETEIIKLNTLINNLSGGENNTNLYLVNILVQQNSENIKNLENLNEEINKSLSDLQTNIIDNYVTIDSITNEESETNYIFVKNSEFNNYKESLLNQISTNSIKLNESVLNLENSNLFFNNEKIALDKNVPLIEVLNNDSYENLPEKNENTYYYIYDNEENYISNSEFSEYKTNQNNNITTLESKINNVELNLNLVINNIGSTPNIPDNINTIWEAINDLYIKINELTTMFQSLN